MEARDTPLPFCADGRHAVWVSFSPEEQTLGDWIVTEGLDFRRDPLCPHELTKTPKCAPASLGYPGLRLCAIAVLCLYDGAGNGDAS